MRLVSILVTVVAFGGVVSAATLDESKARYKELCLHEAGGDPTAPKACKCLIKKIEQAAGEAQAELTFAVMVADDEDLDDAAAAASVNLTVENYIVIRDQTRELENAMRGQCRKDM